MSKSNVCQASSLNSLLKANKGESFSYRQIFEWIGKIVPFEIGLIVSTMPRGGLQIVQPQRIPETMARLYSKQFHAEDKPTWDAILQQKALTGRDSFSDFDSNPFVTEYMNAIGLQAVAAVPLRQPVLNGYAGALVLFRGPEQGEFKSADLSEMEEIAAELDTAIDKYRSQRIAEACSRSITLLHRAPVRQFVFNKSMQQLMPDSDMNQLEENVR